MKKIVDGLTTIEKVVSGIAVAIMAALVVLDIVGREILGMSFPWAQKAAVYLMIWAGFVGASITASKGAHLRPEIADGLWPKSMTEIYSKLRHFITAVFSFFAFYYSVIYIQESIEFGDMNPILKLPLWVVQLIIPYTFLSIGFKGLIFTFFKNARPPLKREIH